MDWLPIESCPRDDIPNNPGVIVWNGEIVTVAWWDDESWQGAIDAPEYCDNRLDPQPTHWMPFPRPPGGVK